MVIKLYNTLSRKKEKFKPIHKGKVGIYSCGPTVYWYQHIGNMRSYIFSDLLKRVLIYNGYKVKHVINVTDVGHLTSDADTGEDKMEKAAKKEKKKAKDIANYYLGIFKDDLKKLNILEPDFFPKATEHIKEQIELIKKLEKKGFTYKTSDGIYFDSSKFKNYGKLGKLNIKELQEGKRVKVGEKKHKTDFALWKFSEKESKRQQEWNSPWGIGFPGWHLECSAMSIKYLGNSFDIHTGGQEHIGVHHTNEIAQSEAATGKKFVNYWMHGAWLLSKGEKVSKSKGGLYTLSELEKKGFAPLVYRYFCLTKHYKKPLGFTLSGLTSAKNSLNRLKEIVSKLDKSEKINNKNTKIAEKQFLEIINNDLNISKAIAFMWEILREDKLNDSEKYELVLKFDEVFGLKLDEVEKVKTPSKISKLIKSREQARKKKDFKTADKIRDKIKKPGYVLEDTEKGVEVKKG